MVTKSFENNSDTNHGLNSHRKTEDASFMREAIRLSQLAVEHGNEPFGHKTSSINSFDKNAAGLSGKDNRF